MSRGVRLAAAALLALGGLGLSFLAAGAAEDAAGLSGRWSARYELPQAAQRNLDEIAEDFAPEGAAFALASEETREIEAPLFGRRKRLTFIAAAGDASLLFMPGRLLAGGYPALPDDCLIDESTALELWGTASPLGFEIICGENTYTVRGVVKAARPLLLTDGEDTGQGFSSVYYYGGKDAAFPRQSFEVLLAALSPAVAFVEETGLAENRLRFLSLLPLWLASGFLGLRCLAVFLRLRRGMTVAAAPPVFFGAALLLKLPNIITPDMLPASRADFSFWPRRLGYLLDRACEGWFLRGGMPGLLLLLEAALPVLALSLISLALFWAAYKVQNISN